LTVAPFHCAHRVTTFRILCALVTLLSLGGCRGNAPSVGTSPEPVLPEGILSGTVRSPAGTSPAGARTVEVVNVATGERQRTSTSNAGSFTFKLKPGQYRVELTLRDGESLVKQPGVIDVNHSDAGAHADFVVRASGVARPRHRAPRADDGLGSAVA
jgi:hypothetical protein